MINIQQLSLEVSIGVDTLRIWERRYGFPNPRRDSRGHRRYPLDQVEQLRVIKKLQILGFRPNKILALSAAERKKLLSTEQQTSAVKNKNLSWLATDLEPAEIERELRSQLKQLGLQKFILQIAAPLLQILGHGWENGHISIGREHIVSDRLEMLLKEQLNSSKTQSTDPSILFLTLSGEQHKIGLLLAVLLFRQEGIGGLYLNEEMPLSEVPILAEELGVSAVAVSFSDHYSNRRAKKDLAELRNTMTPQIKLIAGGNGVKKGVKMSNLYICTDLNTIPKLCRRVFPAQRNNT